MSACPLVSLPLCAFVRMSLCQQVCQLISLSLCMALGTPRGGDLGGLGDGPPKFEVGTAHASAPPNILRSSVVGCAGKYEKSYKNCFSCEERVICDI